MKAAAALVFIAAAYMIAGTAQYHDEVGMARDRAEQAERMPPALRLQTDPVNPPRCPLINGDGMPLLEGYAYQADGGEWTHECWYGIRT